MRLIDTTCKNCGANLQVDLENNSLFCSHCGAQLLVDEEVQHIVCDNAEDAGYQFEKGRQRAQREAGSNPRTHNNSKPHKRRLVWLWVIGWILIFPLPLTILMVRNKKINIILKIGIIAVSWLLYLIIGLSGTSNSDTAETNTTTLSDASLTNVYVESDSEQTQLPSETVNTEPSVSLEYDGDFMIDAVVSSFNDTSDVDLIYVEDFIPSDRSSGHYRTEFRLNAYSEATGKSYTYEGITIDIVCHSNMFSDPSIRLYADGLSLEQVTEIMDIISPIFDTDISSSDVQDALDFVNEHYEANGYYYGDLGLVVLGNDNTGYSLMIKND